ncbi:MAG: manganese efflux pump [Bacteroidaceae bacterium]|nr:manganese efflux pump [Bacteroidaceae bacterium]
MTHVEIWLMALALAMDCFAVSVASGIIFKRVTPGPMIAMILLFGLFQALNPMIGWFGANHFRSLIQSIDHWIAFGILAFLGARMIAESFKQEEEKSFDPRSYKVIFTLAIATSIDALAVGISFSCMGYTSLGPLTYPLVAIGIASSLLTFAGLSLGLKFGKGFSQKLRAELWGGIILIFIGIKVLIEHATSHGL